MIKKLVKHGNSLALIFDKPILDLLKIDKDTPLEITTNGEGFHVRPIRDTERYEEIKSILERLDDQYGDVLANLAKGE
ncbi:hypothetical protein BMS3Bbin04_02042 [bacterium BMS3Bbin04]|nr:hypothetical protein BMS3Bbin04_02042 [bacterium BMS3Bbin04]